MFSILHIYLDQSFFFYRTKHSGKRKRFEAKPRRQLIKGRAIDGYDKSKISIEIHPSTNPVQTHTMKNHHILSSLKGIFLLMDGVVINFEEKSTLLNLSFSTWLIKYHYPFKAGVDEHRRYTVIKYFQ